MPDQIGPYRIDRKLGEGGMGVVYAAHDDRLGRAVAIKTIRATGDSAARERFFREARAAAALSHPNVCQLFDIGEKDGTPFLVMELLEGESLAERLARGTLSVREASSIALSMLTALEALHARGFIHRDLKPSNVFLTAHGVKILDFGLARETTTAIADHDTPTLQMQGEPLTVPGMILGTPRYMAPEQLLGRPADARTDLFAVGAMLYEIVSGAPVFQGDTQMALFHAIVYEPAPNLGGSAAVAALNRIIHRALEKDRENRYQSAAAMARDLRELMLMSHVGEPVVARRVTRLIVLPFRLLRDDAEIGFLAQALPDAITTSLAGIGSSLVVRSPLAAARFAGAELADIAREADVDVVLTGTLLRAGEQLRVTTQLVEVPAGTIVWSLTSQGTLAGLFELQDALTQRIVTSLELPLTDRERSALQHDVPASPRAHEFYLRAGQQGQSPGDWAVARDLYRQSLEEDPRYAPAWARLARIHLLLGKYTDGSEGYDAAEEALRRALDLNPDLPIAHHVYAQLDVARGRAREAMLRLLTLVEKGTNNPDVFAGLVMALRFCGLLDESAAAHDQARQLDPSISTSAQHTFWMKGDYERALATVDHERDFGGDAAFIYESMGDLARAGEILEERLRRITMSDSWKQSGVAKNLLTMFAAVISGDTSVVEGLRKHRDFRDPEGLYFMGRCLARLGAYDDALDFLDKSERDGFFCFPAFARDAWLDPLRGEARFTDVLRRAESRMRAAAMAFAEHPGSRVLAVGLRS